MTKGDLKEIPDKFDSDTSRTKTLVDDTIWDLIYKKYEYYVPDDVKTEIIKKRLKNLFENKESCPENKEPRLETQYYRYSPDGLLPVYHIEMTHDVENCTRTIKIRDVLKPHIIE